MDALSCCDNTHLDCTVKEKCEPVGSGLYHGATCGYRDGGRAASGFRLTSTLAPHFLQLLYLFLSIFPSLFFPFLRLSDSLPSRFLPPSFTQALFTPVL